MKIKDLTGMVFGSLTVKYQAEKRNGRVYWRCGCVCGKEKDISRSNLTSGQAKSCGCQRSQRISRSLIKHGKAHTKIYKIWEAMKRRCDSPSSGRFQNYGGRGISYSPEWSEFEAFYKWAIGSGYKEGLSIERVNVDGNYEPKNCKWVEPKQQHYNKTNTIYLEHEGKKLCIAEWSEATGIPYATIYQRVMRLGWPTERALTEMSVLGRNQYGA